MVTSPRADERTALLFDELASILDAGLSPETLTGRTTGDSHWRSGLEQHSKLAPSEVAIFEAAEQAGRLPDALRRAAHARRDRAALRREIGGRLRYPLVLVVVGAVVSYLGALATGSSTRTAIQLPVLVLAVAGVAAVSLRALCAAELARNWPLFGGIVRDRGILPYLHALHGLYEAGIPLRDGHARAATTTPFPWLHVRLVAAGLALENGRPLVESLVSTGVLDGETTRILEPAERAGDLSGGLARAIRRREETLQRGIGTLVDGIVTAGTALGFAIAAYVIFSFYSAYLGRSGLLGR